MVVSKQGSVRVALRACFSDPAAKCIGRMHSPEEYPWPPELSLHRREQRPNPKNALGNYRSNDGKVYREDALGDWRSGSR